MDKNYNYQHNKRERRHTHETPAREENVDKLETFLDMPCKEIEVTCPPLEERKRRRREFETITRVKFLKFLAITQKEQLNKAGFSNKEIQQMAAGKTPNGWNTHHKQSIYAGGTNDFDNLILIRRRPYHDMLHYHLINPQLQGMQEGETRKVNLPIPEENVYVPTRSARHLERDAERGKTTYGHNKDKYLKIMEEKEDPYLKDVIQAELYSAAVLKKLQGGR